MNASDPASRVAALLAQIAENPTGAVSMQLRMISELCVAHSGNHLSIAPWDVAILENVMVLNPSVESAVQACKILRLANACPATEILDLLVDKAGIDNIHARLSALRCLDALCDKQDWAPLLASPGRRIITTLTEAVALPDTGDALEAQVRFYASCAISRLCGHAQVRPYFLLQAAGGTGSRPPPVSVFVEAIKAYYSPANNARLSAAAPELDTQRVLCQALGRLGVEADAGLLRSLLRACSPPTNPSGPAEALSFLVRVHSTAHRLALPEMGLAGALEGILGQGKLRASTMEAVGHLLVRCRLTPSSVALSSLCRLCLATSYGDRRMAVWVMDSLAMLDINKEAMRTEGGSVLAAMQCVICDESPLHDSRALACCVLASLNMAPDTATLRCVLAGVKSPMGITGPHTPGQQPEKVQREALHCVANLARSHDVRNRLLLSSAITAVAGGSSSGGITESVGSLLHSIALQAAPGGGVQERACMAIGVLGIAIEPALMIALSAQITSSTSISGLPEAAAAASALSHLLESYPIVRAQAASLLGASPAGANITDIALASMVQSLQDFLLDLALQGLFPPACEHILGVLGKLGCHLSGQTVSRLLLILDGQEPPGTSLSASTSTHTHTPARSPREDVLAGLRSFARSAKAFDHPDLVTALDSDAIVAATLRAATSPTPSPRLTEAAYRLLMVLASHAPSCAALLRQDAHGHAMRHLAKTQGDAGLLARHECTYAALMIFNLAEWPAAAGALKEVCRV